MYLGQDHIRNIRYCRRIVLIGNGSSYNAAMGVRAFLEEVTELPIMVERAGHFLDRKMPIYRCNNEYPLTNTIFRACAVTTVQLKKLQHLKNLNLSYVFFPREDTCIIISQSGETEETVAALDYCTERKALTMGVTNVVGSRVSLDTMFGCHMRAGQELGVTASKSYTTPMLILVLFCIMFANNQKKFRERSDRVRMNNDWCNLSIFLNNQFLFLLL
jgi:glucosamine--fructose-6-phosphate aminotransferase (isomerizing)